MTLLFAVVVIGIIAGAFLYGAGRWAGLPPAPADRRPAGAADSRGFDVVVRGYRMDEVDARIAELEQEVARLRTRPRGESADPR